MTCIVGIVDREAQNVLLASDSLGILEGGLKVRTGTKLWSNGGFVLGLAGTMAQSQALRSIDFQEGVSDLERIYAWLKLACEATGFYTPAGSGSMGVSGWTLLIAKGADIWQSGSSRTLMPQTDLGHFAIGSGAPYAFGAIYASRRGGVFTAEAQISLAMNAACEHDAYCGAPIHCMRTETSTSLLREA